MPKLSVESINQKLEGTGIELELRGKKLSLRATLPNKSGKGTKQQRISLKLGTDQESLKIAELKALELHSQRLRGCFSWDKWGELEEDPPPTKTTAQLIEEFRQFKLAQGLSERSWKSHYYPYFKALPQDELLSEKEILNIVLSKKPNTMTRKEACDRLATLAKFTGLEINLLPYKGNYSAAKAEPRDLPTDEQIIQVRELAFSRERYFREECLQWQWVYGVMATYGMRDCEVMFCEIEPNPPYRCNVIKGKTGKRVAFPLNPQWPREWELFNINKPAIQSTEYWECGEKISYGLSRKMSKLPDELRHKPYDLRHAYALRGATKYNIPARIMAGMMGHTVDVHLKIYSRWLNQNDIERVYLGAIGADSFSNQFLSSSQAFSTPP